MIKNDIEKSNIIEKLLNYFNISKKNTCKKPIEIYNNLQKYFQSEEQIINCYENLISILSYVLLINLLSTNQRIFLEPRHTLGCARV